MQKLQSFFGFCKINSQRKKVAGGGNIPDNRQT